MFYRYSDINKIWEVAPVDQEHFIKIGYNKNDDILNAVLFKYTDQRKKPYHILYGINTVNGDILYKFGLPNESCEFAFAQNGTKLICSSGEIYDLTVKTPELIYKFKWN